MWEAQENWDSWYEGTIKPNLPEGIKPRIATRELYDVVQPEAPSSIRNGCSTTRRLVRRSAAPA